MQCKECNYPLWNIRHRCPECGTSFTPGEFEFAPNKVEYCCPHCEQPYYGTDPQGHLVPREFECVSCHAPIRMDDMPLRPAPGVTESAARPVRMPWLDRGDRSAAKALFATIGMALGQPGRLIQAVPEASPLGPAWKFAIVTNALTMVARLLPALCFMGVMPFIFNASTTGAGTANAPPGPGVPLLLAIMGGAIGAGFVISMVVLAFSLLVWPPVCHAVLLATGGAAAGLRRTTQAILYGSGANASSAIPCLDNLGGIWWIVSAILMVRAGQKVHGGRATLAVLVFPLVLLFVIVGGYIAFVGAMVMGATGGAGGPAFTTPAVIAAGRIAEAQAMYAQVAQYAAGHDGRGPAHAVALVTEQGMAPGNLIAAGTNTSHQTVPVGGVTLSRLQREGVMFRREATARAADALPPDVVAHRLGDYVFTYHGFGVTGLDMTGVESTGVPAGLWGLILSPDPDLNPGDDDAVCVAQGGLASRVPAGMMQQMLRGQNAIRARAGLAPLPDPSTVTHDEPAVAERGP